MILYPSLSPARSLFELPSCSLHSSTTSPSRRFLEKAQRRSVRVECGAKGLEDVTMNGLRQRCCRDGVKVYFWTWESFRRRGSRLEIDFGRAINFVCGTWDPSKHTWWLNLNKACSWYSAITTAAVVLYRANTLLAPIRVNSCGWNWRVPGTLTYIIFHSYRASLCIGPLPLLPRLVRKIGYACYVVL